MLAPELRYVASLAALTGVILVPLAIAITVGSAMHIPASAFVLLCLALTAVSAFLAVVFWSRLSVKNASARSAPILVSTAVVITFAFTTASRIGSMNETHWHVGLDSFAASIIVAVFFSILALRSGAAEPNAKIDANGRRGYVRLGLIACEVPLMLILVPRVGETFGLVGSVTIISCVFLVLNRRFAL